VTIKRIAAVLCAVALIIGALLIRNGLDDSSSSSSGTTNAPSGGETTVVCSTDFAAVCAALGKNYTTTVESAGITLDRLSTGTAVPPDAWITLDPLPGMLETMRAINNLSTLTTSVTAIATDTPALAVPSGRKDSIDLGCAGLSIWRCVGSAAGTGWTTLDPGAQAGEVLVGLADPATEDVGLITFANAVAGYFGVVQQDNGSFRDSGFTSWLRNFSNNAKIVALGTSPLSTLLVRKTEVNVAATSASELAANERRSEVAIITVEPAIASTAVVATFTSRGSSVAGKAGPLLLAAGWTAPSDPQPQLPAGTFVALRALWKEYNK
jgi:hypothetical protein